MAIDSFQSIFRSGAPQQFGLHYGAQGAEGPNTPSWYGLNGEDPSAILGKLQPYMDMSGADLEANWGTLPADVLAKLGATPTDFAKKISFEPDGQGGWKNTFVEKGGGLEDYILPALIAGVGGLGLGMWGPGSLAAGSGGGALAGGAFDMGGMAGLEGGFGIGGAGIEGGMGAGADAFGNFDLGFGAGGTTAPTGLPTGEFSLTDLTNVPTGGGGVGDGGGADYSSPATEGPTANAANQSALQRIANGTATSADWIKILGTAGSTALGLFGANTQSNAYADLAKQFADYGAPYREQLKALMANPDTFYNSTEGKQTLEAVLRRLSVGGNPANNPYKQSLAIGALYDKLQGKENQLANFGGLTAFNNAAPGAAANAAGTSGNTLQVLGYGLDQLTRPTTSLQQLLAAIGGSRSL